MGIEGILERLIKARKWAGLSQSQVAKMLGMDSAATISHYETGMRQLSLEHFLKLCEFYDVSPIWALSGTNPHFDPAPIMEAAHKVKMAASEFDDLMDMLEASERPPLDVS